MATSTTPLSDDERTALLRNFVKDPDSLESQLSHLIYSTGMHPAVPADPTRWNVHVETHGDVRLLVWVRPKNKKLVAIPYDPGLDPWFPNLLEVLRLKRYHPVYVNQLVHAFGTRSGILGLTPRSLRHDYCFRAVGKHGVVIARELTGTTTDVLMGYARRQISLGLAPV